MARSLLIFSLSLAIALIAKSNGEIKITIEPAVETMYVVEPAHINITCTCSSCPVNTPLNWQKDSTDVASLGFNVMSKETTSGSSQTIVKNAIKPTSSVSDSGRYVCSSGTATFYLNVEVLKVEVTEPIYERNMGTASLSCNTTIPPVQNQIPEYTTKWQRNYKDLTDLENFKEKYVVHKDTFTLDILEAERADADKYQCVLMFNESREVSVDVRFFATPLVKRFEKSKNMIQGDPFELKCAVYGYPKPNVTWMKDDVVLEASERITFKSYGGVENTILSIDPIEFEDKGTYRCNAAVVTPPVNGTSNSTIIVRVKDKLAALWPFLGIVAEVIILCIIIFIYEKKRSKDEPADDDDTNVKSGGSNAAESNEVRQRNVRT